MTQKFALRSAQFEGHVLLTFDEKGWLKGFVNEADLTNKQHMYMVQRLPWCLTELPCLVGDSKTLRITPVVEDLSFATFWNAYAYKVGHKTRAEKLWDKLNEADRQLCIDSLIPYTYYLMCHPNIERLYAETYLAQRRFENDYKALSKK